MSVRRRRLQWAAAALLIAVYAGLSYYSESTADAHHLGASLAVAPLTGFAVLLAWRTLPSTVAGFLTVGVAGLLYGCWPTLLRHFALFDLIQASSFYALLGLSFARSLLFGSVALCTRLADQIHGPLAPAEVRYTRHVTAAWAVFFFANTLASIGLYVAAPLRIWSCYVNFCVLPLVAAMFVAEYWVRRRILPDGKRAGLLATVRVYLASPQSS
jgi:uncharacterized membrane protein